LITEELFKSKQSYGEDILVKTDIKLKNQSHDFIYVYVSIINAWYLHTYKHAKFLLQWSLTYSFELLMSTREYHYCCLLITTQYIEPLTFKHVTGECIIRSIPLRSLSTFERLFSMSWTERQLCVSFWV